MDTVMRNAICPKQAHPLTLRFHETGKSFRSLVYQFRISRNAISYINDQVCKVIVTVLAGTYLKFQSAQEDWRNIEKIPKRNGLSHIA